MWQEAPKLHGDIISVQETHFQCNAITKCSHKDSPNLFLAWVSLNKRGVLFRIKNVVSFNLKDSVIDPEGRYIILNSDINAQPYTLVSVYAPSSHQIWFLCKIVRNYPMSNREISSYSTWRIQFHSGPTSWLYLSNQSLHHFLEGLIS